MDELISRQKVIDVLNEGLDKIPYINNTDTEMIRRDERICCIQEVAGLPTVPRKGEWIYGESEIGNDGYYCSKCGNFVPWKYGEYDIDFIKEFLFCNKCGSDMRPQYEEPEINPCRGCEDYDWKGGCKSKGGCAKSRGDADVPESIT